MNKNQKDQLTALAAMIDYATKKPIIDKSELKELEQKVDTILAEMQRQTGFFKRLAK